MTLKIGMIGAGGIAKGAHGNALKKITELAEVIAVSDVNMQAAKELANEVGATHIFEDYNELLQLKEIDAVVITTPNFLHSTIAIQSLTAGKHVLCEKPLAMNAEQAELMVSTAKNNGLILMTALNNRYREDVKTIKNYVETGQAGDIYHAKCGWTRRSGIPGWGGWFTKKDLSGGGPLIDLGVHMLDLTLYLMGDPKVISVSGATYQKFGPYGTSRAWGVANENGTYDVEDLATAFVRLDNGATLSLDASWAANIKEEKVYVNLLGDKSGIQIDNKEGTVIFTEENGELKDIYPDVVFDDGTARVNMWKHFIECIQEGKEPISSGEKGLLINKILDAIYLSSETGKEIRF